MTERLSLPAIDELAVSLLRRDPMWLEVARVLPAAVAATQRTDGIDPNGWLRRAQTLLAAAAEEILEHHRQPPMLPPPQVDEDEIGAAAPLDATAVAALVTWSYRTVTRRGAELGGLQASPSAPWRFDRSTVLARAAQLGVLADVGHSASQVDRSCA